MKIVVRGANWIGDAVMTIPALRRLRSAFPHASITLHTRSWADGIFRDADFIDEVLPITQDRTFTGLFRQARELSTREFDTAILFPNSFRSALVARLAGIPRRVGYATELRSFLLTDPVSVPDWKRERHEGSYYLHLVDQLVGSSAERPPEASVAVSEERRSQARTLLSEGGMGREAKVVGLGVGSTNSRAKRWPAANFGRLADLLSTRCSASVVILGGADEKNVSSTVVSLSGTRPLDLTGQTDLGTATAILSELDLFISNDMGLAHIAGAVGTPTIVIFGPTDEKTTRPLGTSVEIMREPVDCAPCMLRDCPIDHRCMTRITPDRVIETAVKMLETRPQ